MNNNGSKEQQIKRILEQTVDYIENPAEYVCRYFEHDMSAKELIKCIKLVIEHNQQVIASLNEKNDELTNLITMADLEVEPNKEEIVSEVNVLPSSPNAQPDDSTTNTLSNTEITEKVIHINHDEFYDYYENNPYIRNSFPSIKLAIISVTKKLKNKLITMIANNPLEDVSYLQTQLSNYNDILETIALIEMENKEIPTADNTMSESDILVIPNYKGSSYLLDDIMEYPERFKDIQNAFSKILSGGIKDSKSIKQLGSVNQKLYEYCNKTGLRILFMKMDNGKIALSLLFYKDKQKSTKIKAYYMEALKRFELQKDQLNIDDIDFRIEQLQLINEINEVTTKQEVHSLKWGF